MYILIKSSLIFQLKLVLSVLFSLCFLNIGAERTLTSVHSRNMHQSSFRKFVILNNFRRYKVEFGGMYLYPSSVS